MLQVKDGIKYRFYIQMMPLANNVSQAQHIDINISDQISNLFVGFVMSCLSLLWLCFDSRCVVAYIY